MFKKKSAKTKKVDDQENEPQYHPSAKLKKKQDNAAPRATTKLHQNQTRKPSNGELNERATCSKSANLTKVSLNPYTSQTLYLMKKFKNQQPKETVILTDGMTLDQWGQINRFQITGQSQIKKKNYNIALDHFFNLRSMYRKINGIRYKKAPSIRLQNPNIFMENEANLKRSSSVKKTQKSVKRKAETLLENNDKLKSDEMIVKRKKKIKSKKESNFEPEFCKSKTKNDIPGKEAKNKIKKVKKIIQIEEELIPHEKKARKVGTSKDKNEPGKNVNKKSCQKQKEQSENETEQKLHQNQLKKAKKNQNTQTGNEKKLKEDSAKKESSNRIDRQENQKSSYKKYQTNEENEFENSVIRKNEFSNQSIKLGRSQSVKKESEFSEIDNFENNQKTENDSEADEDEIMKYIPELEDGENEEKVSEFRNKLIEAIMEFQIFEEDEFENFFEAVCRKNNSIERESIADIFEEVKTFLCEQYQNME